jgi:hypothetical protein
MECLSRSRPTDTDANTRSGNIFIGFAFLTANYALLNSLVIYSVRSRAHALNTRNECSCTQSTAENASKADRSAEKAATIDRKGLRRASATLPGQIILIVKQLSDVSQVASFAVRFSFFRRDRKWK